MAMCVTAVVAVAPCQCFSPGSNRMTSPGRISSTGPPHRRAQPQPAVTMSTWPSGCVCQAVRAPGSKVTLAELARAGACASNSMSIRTAPVNHSAGPLPEGREPTRLISMCRLRVGRRGVQLNVDLLKCDGQQLNRAALQFLLNEHSRRLTKFKFLQIELICIFHADTRLR